MPLIMGVINVTPDSFVDEVRTPRFGDAVERARLLIDEGAHILDVGGESTRPTASHVSESEEIDRVVPVVATLREHVGDQVRLSVDTRRESVARAAVAAGADIINDMGATLGAVAGELGVDYVAAHMQGTPETMQLNPTYDDVVGEVLAEVLAAARVAADAGSPKVWIDPGIGFGKATHHNLELLANLDQFVATEFGVLVGVSRKSLIGYLHAASDAGLSVRADELAPTATDDRLEGSLAVAAWCGLLGAEVLRVHDVEPSLQAARVVAARDSA